MPSMSAQALWYGSRTPAQAAVHVDGTPSQATPLVQHVSAMDCVKAMNAEKPSQLGTGVGVQWPACVHTLLLHWMVPPLVDGV
jgi:hypothetical protein